MKNKLECPYQYSCGGCDLLNLQYDDQLLFKNSATHELFEKSGLIFKNIEPILPANKHTQYRNKIQYNFDITYEGEILCGNYALNSHHLISIDRCLLENELTYRIKSFFLQLMKDFDILPHCNEQPNGSIKNLVIRTNFDCSEAMIVLVTNSNFLPKSKMLVNNLIKEFPEIKSIVQIVNNRHSGYILDGEASLLFGRNYIIDQLSGFTYHISPTSFFQVNLEQTEKLYKKVLELSNLQKDDLLLDAYCGIGTIGITASHLVKEVMGIEIITEAVEDARDNAERNNVTNIKYKAGDVSKVIERIQDFKPTVVIVDPPRGGLSQKFIGYINYNKPPILTYISCNQKTLVRDLQLLSNNYSIETIQPLDMFPLTKNIETIVLLHLK